MLRHACLTLVGTVVGQLESDIIFHETWENLDNWQHEVTFHRINNEVQYYRNDRRNSWVEDGMLVINPTITADEYSFFLIYCLKEK